MSATAVAIMVLLLLGSTSAYLGFRRDAGTGIAGMLGLVLVGPCLAAAWWCLWWSASQEGHVRCPDRCIERPRHRPPLSAYLMKAITIRPTPDGAGPQKRADADRDIPDLFYV
jgi:hypothetical protein